MENKSLNRDHTESCRTRICTHIQLTPRLLSTLAARLQEILCVGVWRRVPSLPHTYTVHLPNLPACESHSSSPGLKELLCMLTYGYSILALPHPWPSFKFAASLHCFDFDYSTFPISSHYLRLLHSWGNPCPKLCPSGLIIPSHLTSEASEILRVKLRS